MTMRKRGFADKYRPETFEAVRGQAHPVRILSELIKAGQKGYNLLLHGAVGSGKTSLIRLFEKGLNCLQPTEAGSPCGKCRSCQIKDRELVGLREYDVSGWGGKRTDFERWFQMNYKTPTDYNWQVLFFDEAHSLTKEASDSLLKAVEEPIDRVIFCFATTEYELIRPALRSRLLQLEVRPLIAPEAIRLLRETANQEELDYEPEALTLLAGITGGQPRDLLKALEEVSIGGHKLTEQYVREHLDVDHKPALIAYFEALAEGDFARQTETIDNWRETPTEKAKWISAFLLALYYNQICATKLVVDPVIDSIQHERTEIIARFQTRFELAERRELRPYWRRMLEFWNRGIAQDDAAALLQLTLFHLLINEELRNLPIADPPQTAIAPDQRRLSVHTMRLTNHGSESDQEFLAPEGAGMIIDLASFLIQEYGVGFNAAFEVHPWRRGAKTEAAARTQIEQFLADLDQHVSSSGGASFAYLALLERHEGLTRALVVAHLPRISDRELVPEWQRRVRSWAKHWCRTTNALQVRLSSVAGRYSELSIDWKFHWDETLNLCCGLGEDAAVLDTSEGESHALLDLLRIPKGRRRSPGPVAGGLLLPSALLHPDKIKEATRAGLPPLSAFQDRAWDHIRGRWELREFKERRALEQERLKKIAEIEQTYGPESDAARAEIAKFRGSWPLNPHDRPRRWKTWREETD